jgi:RNA polymerase sigma-70 factor (ECF subfamily)
VPPGAETYSLLVAESDDAELVRRARRGDADAFAALVRAWKERAYRTAYHMTGNHGDADDVTQDAFVRAYRGLGGFDERAAFGTWLHRIVVNSALNHLRAHRRRRAHLAEPQAGAEVPTAAPDAAARAESRELARAVQDALEELSPTLRVTLVLATVEQMAYKDIAQELGVPEGTVAWRVNQARKTLRKRLAARAPDLEGNVDEVLRRTKAALGAP